MGNSQSVSGQVGVGSHVPGDTVNKRVDTKREQRPDPSQTVETDKSSSHPDSEKEVEEMEVPDPRLSYNSQAFLRELSINRNRVVEIDQFAVFRMLYLRTFRK